MQIWTELKRRLPVELLEGDLVKVRYIGKIALDPRSFPPPLLSPCRAVKIAELGMLLSSPLGLARCSSSGKV